MDDKNVKYELHPHNDVDRIRQKFQKDGIPSGGGSGEAGYSVEKSTKVFFPEQTVTFESGDGFFEAEIENVDSDEVLYDNDLTVIKDGEKYILKWYSGAECFCTTDPFESLGVSGVINIAIWYWDGAWFMDVYGLEESEESVISGYYDTVKIDVTEDFALARGYSVNTTSEEKVMIPEQEFTLESTGSGAYIYEALELSDDFTEDFKKPMTFVIDDVTYENIPYDDNNFGWMIARHEDEGGYLTLAWDEGIPVITEFVMTTPIIDPMVSHTISAVATVTTTEVKTTNDFKKALEAEGFAFYVKLLGNSTDGYFANKGYSEIKNAYDSGKVIVFTNGESSAIATYNSDEQKFEAILHSVDGFEAKHYRMEIIEGAVFYTLLVAPSSEPSINA